MHWSTNRKGRRRLKNTLLATLKYVYLKNHRRCWWEISSVFEVLIFKRRRGYVCICKEGGVADSEDRLVFSQPHVSLSETYLCIPLTATVWTLATSVETLNHETWQEQWLAHGDWDSVRGHRGGDWSLVDFVSQAQSKSTDNIGVVLKDSINQ